MYIYFSESSYSIVIKINLNMLNTVLFSSAFKQALIVIFVFGLIIGLLTRMFHLPYVIGTLFLVSSFSALFMLFIIYLFKPSVKAK